MVLRFRVREKEEGGRMVYLIERSTMPFVWIDTGERFDDRREAERRCAMMQKLAERIL